MSESLVRLRFESPPHWDGWTPPRLAGCYVLPGEGGGKVTKTWIDDGRLYLEGTVASNRIHEIVRAGAFEIISVIASSGSARREHGRDGRAA